MRYDLLLTSFFILFPFHSILCTTVSDTTIRYWVFTQGVVLPTQSESLGARTPPGRRHKERSCYTRSHSYRSRDGVCHPRCLLDKRQHYLVGEQGSTYSVFMVGCLTFHLHYITVLQYFHKATGSFLLLSPNGDEMGFQQADQQCLYQFKFWLHRYHATKWSPKLANIPHDHLPIDQGADSGVAVFEVITKR